MTGLNLELPPGVLIHHFPDPVHQARALAGAVSRALVAGIRAHGTARLLVSGGRSPVAFLEQLSRQPLDWRQVTVSPVDERWVPPGHPDSNEGLLRCHLLRQAAAPARLVGLYQPGLTPEAAAARASQQLAGLPWPVDALVLGMGEDGHTASLFPGSPLLARGLSPDCPECCLVMQAPVAPHVRLSLTWPLLASARLQCLAIQGPRKLETLRQALQADPLQSPVRAFLQYPLEIYWCP